MNVYQENGYESRRDYLECLSDDYGVSKKDVFIKKTVYKITEKGAEILKNRMYKTLSEYDGRNDPDFYMAFSMLPYLSEDQLIKAFTNSLKIIKTHKLELEKMLANSIATPLNVRGLFIHPIKILQKEVLRNLVVKLNGF